MNGDGITRVRYDPSKPPRGETDWARVDAMTEDEIEANAATDPDNPEATDEELGQMRRLYPNGTVPFFFGIDEEVLAWFKGLGPEETIDERVREALRDYVASKR